LREAAEGDTCRASGFGGGHTAAHVFLGQHREVVLQFTVELLAEPPVRHRAAYPRNQYA
jgi:hypothetical protein